MTSQKELHRIYMESAALKARDSRDQLAYRHMLVLADHFEGWALDKRITREQVAELMGQAENMRQLAALVGPDWDPPRPERLSLLGFMARNMLGEA